MKAGPFPALLLVYAKVSMLNIHSTPKAAQCHGLRIKWNCAQSGSKSRKKDIKALYVDAPNTATAYQKEGPHQYGGSFLTLASESGTIVNRVPLTETL